MKLLCCIILQILASVSGQKNVSPELPDSAEVSLPEINPGQALEVEKTTPEDGKIIKEMDPVGASHRGLRGRHYYGEMNVGNGGDARTGNAYGPYGTTGHARGGDGGDNNIVVRTGYRRHCGRRCRGGSYGPYYGYGGDMNVGNGGNAQSGNAYGPFGTTGNARGGDGGDNNIVIDTGYRGRYPSYPPYYYGPYYGGTTNVGNGGDAETGDAYGPFGTTGDAIGGDGGDGNVVVNGWYW